MNADSSTMHNLTDPEIEWYIQNEDWEDREIFGFPRRKIIYDIKRFLHSTQYTVGRENKINVTRDMFTYLATTDCKKFIQTYNRFANAVKEKIVEFRYKENIREAQRWWRDIFGTRIPIES